MSYVEPPDGWFTFGSHLDYVAPLEFSEELDEEGHPRFERPLAKKYSPHQVAEMMLDFLGEQVPEHERSWFAGQIIRAIDIFETGF